MEFQHLHCLVIFMFLWYPFTFTICYIMSVMLRHTDPLFPYVSYTGTFSPESCVFSFLLSLGTLLQMGVIYVRYRQVRAVLDNNTFSQRTKRANFISLVLAMLAVVGVLILASFQTRNAKIVHTVAAYGAFVSLCLYIAIQVYLSFKLYPIVGSWPMNVFRVILTVATYVSFFLTTLCAFLSIPEFRGHDRTKWKRTDGGYDLHLASTFSELVMILCVNLFLLSFSCEFRNLSIGEPIISNVEICSN